MKISVNQFYINYVYRYFFIIFRKYEKDNWVLICCKPIALVFFTNIYFNFKKYC